MTSAAERLSQMASSLTAGGMLPSTQITGSQTGAGHTHVWNEVPTGQSDGISAVLTLASTPVGGSLLLFRNGLLLQAGLGNDYTLVGPVITFLAGNLSQPGDIVLASYVI